MLDHRIRQRSDVSKRQHLPIAHILWEQADTTASESAAEAELRGEGVGDALGPGTSFILTRDGDLLELRDADDVIAVSVGGAVWPGGIPDRISEGLGDA